jgi:tetratricopeptide (TPR) repeat protein
MQNYKLKIKKARHAEKGKRQKENSNRRPGFFHWPFCLLPFAFCLFYCCPVPSSPGPGNTERGTQNAELQITVQPQPPERGPLKIEKATGKRQNEKPDGQAFCLLPLTLPPSPSIPSLAGTNPPALPAGFAPALVEKLKVHLETARHLRNAQRPAEATPLFIALLGDESPDFIKKSALLELAAAAQDQGELPRAQQIYSQYLNRWPDDPYIPEILLRQGHLFRQIGLNNLALAKFYAVMTSALVLKSDQLDYYVRLVTQAQIEVAETHYQLEKYPEAAEFLTRLLKQDSPLINKADAQFKLLRCLAGTGQYDEAVSQSQDFLTRYPGTPEQAEVRFHLALALKQIGRHNEALAQVLTLLREQSARARAEPATWAYWQQRTGNLIANQLYREGDFTRALDIYLSLAELDPSPAWQWPVWYQIGMTYEHLWQPQKAVEIYHRIVSREKELPAAASPGLKAVVEMARWRAGFVEWQHQAENFNHSFHGTNAPGREPNSEFRVPRSPVPENAERATRNPELPPLASLPSNPRPSKN